MDARTMHLVRAGTNGSRPPDVGAGAWSTIGRRAAWWLSAAVAVAMVAASAAGLWVHGLYPDPSWASAASRGGDLVTLMVAAPLLAVALLLARRGSQRAELVWVGMLAYSVYNYAYYVFGLAFNDVFLLHVALFSASLFALILAMASLDVAGIGWRFGARTPARWVGGFLLLVAAVLGVMWSWFSLRFAVTGKLPGGAFPASGQHLVYTLDLSLLVPSFALAGVLLWRRTAWGFVLATLVGVYAAVYQLNYLIASAFQADADVAGAMALDPAALGLTIAFLLAAVLLLGNLRPARR
jgi:hypothetical protein